MAEYCCEDCGKHLFDFDGNRGAAGNVALNLGFIYKMPIAFGIEGSHFFCCNDCWNKWFSEHTTPEMRERGNEAVREFKQKLEDSKPELINGLQQIQTAFQGIKNMKKG